MSRSVTATLVLVLTVTGAALAQQPQPARPNQPDSPWAVSVVHTVDLQKMIQRMREKGKDRIGVPASAPQYVYNVATGLVVDNDGHVVTRLANLDPEDKDQKILITTRDGASFPAQLIGVDCASGFAVLEVSALKVDLPNVAAANNLHDGMPVKILSTDVTQRTIPSEGGVKVYLSPMMTSGQGRIGSASVYSQARGALTLLSNSLLSRNDSSVVNTFGNQVVGIAQYAGFGRAYLYPFEYIRDTVAKRVIAKKGNVPAGWLGAKGDSIAQLPESDIGTLGLAGKTGVIVREVVPDSPAAKVGMMPNDVIVGVDNFEVVGAADLSALLMSSPEGRKIRLRTIRNRQPVELDVTLGARPNSEITYSATFIEQHWEASLSPRSQLEKRLEELKTQHRNFLKASASRESTEALREIDLEIRQIYDALRALGPEPPGPVETAKNDKQPNFPDGGFTTEPGAKGLASRLGIMGRELTPQLASYFQARGGILITSILKDGLAARSGLR
ncbi:MAG TPA: PDZ domain-containing protein, partial [Blastocatellia bacterium]|nr:PDZ domain-containing protein [Blastocatellia bacterium]